MTEELARAASWDAGNRSMRAAGRTIWSQEDADAAWAEFNRLWPEPSLSAVVPQPARENRKAGEYFAAQAGTGYWEVRVQTDKFLIGIRLSDLVCMLPFGPQNKGQKEMAEQIATLLNDARKP